MNWWDVKCCAKKLVLEWFHNWTGLCPKTKHGRAWNSLFFVVSWTIWEAWNQQIFRGSLMSLSQALDTVKFRVA